MPDTVSDYYTDIRLRYGRLSRFTPLSLEAADVSDEEFYTFCMDNPDLRIERNANKQVEKFRVL